MHPIVTGTDAIGDRVTLCLNEHRFLAYKLLDALSHASSNTTPSILRTTDSLFEDVLKKDRVLLQTIKQLNQHQRAQKELDRIKQQIAEKEAKIVAYAKELRTGQQAINSVLLKHKRVLENAKAAPNTPRFPPQDIIAYAHKVASTTSAALNWQPGFAMVGFLPPAPTPEMMRAGVLSRGIIDSLVTKESTAYTATKRPIEDITAPTPLTGEVRINLGTSDEEIEKLFPAGWKAGDAIDLPAEALVRHRGAAIFADYGIEIPANMLKTGNDYLSVPQTYMDQLRAKLEEKNAGHIDKKQRVDDEDSSGSSSSSENDEGYYYLLLTLHHSNALDRMGRTRNRKKHPEFNCHYRTRKMMINYLDMTLKQNAMNIEAKIDFLVGTQNTIFADLMTSNCSASGLLTPDSSKCLALTSKNIAYVTSSSLTSTSTAAVNSALQKAQAASKQATLMLVKCVDDVRGYDQLWFQNSLQSIATFACDSMLSSAEKERCVPIGNSAAVLNGSLCQRVSGNGNCFDQGLCERAANCYWPPPANDREPYYSAADISAAKDWVTHSYPNSFVPFAIPGVFLACIVLLSMVVFLILRCGCNRCYGRNPHRHGYTKLQRVVPITVFGLFTIGIILCAAFAFTQNQVITDGINGSFDAIDMALSNLDTMTNNIDSPLEMISSTVNSTVSQITKQLNPANTSIWMASDMATLQKLTSTFTNRLSSLGPFPLGCTTGGSDVCVSCPAALCSSIPSALTTTMQSLSSSQSAILTIVTTMYNNLQQSQSTIESALSDAATLLGYVQTKATSTQSNLRSAYTSFTSVSSVQIAALLAAFALGLFVCFLGIIGIITGVCSRTCCLIRILNLSWFLGALVCILGFILSAVILIIAMMGNDMCHYVNVLHDNSSAVWPGQMSEILQSCFQNTSLLNALDIDSELSFSCTLEDKFTITNSLNFTPLTAAMTTLSTDLLSIDETTWFSQSPEQLVNEAKAYIPNLTLQNLPTPWKAYGYASLSATGETSCYSASTTVAPRCYMNIKCNGGSTSCYASYVAAYDTYLAEQQIHDSLVELNADFSAATSQHSAGWNTSYVSILNYMTTYTDALTQLNYNVLAPLKSGVVGDILKRVDQMKCSMTCRWLNASYNLLYDSVCSNLVGSTLIISLCIFLMCLFLLPIIFMEIVLEKRLRGLRKESEKKSNAAKPIPSTQA
ncbi:hypothetical protein THRCLA_11344 [Thraustotheca clavata]|uniref:Uncharacterized protein n=1 Tax=Thraustotheca clavata TaxID=74557 RepID=A0A1V9Y7Z7_9STRA|nr:hypothetical protein THRCLA_11344 [Thraustotheca clavata]